MSLSIEAGSTTTTTTMTMMTTTIINITVVIIIIILKGILSEHQDWSTFSYLRSHYWLPIESAAKVFCTYWLMKNDIGENKKSVSSFWILTEALAMDKINTLSKGVPTARSNFIKYLFLIPWAKNFEKLYKEIHNVEKGVMQNDVIKKLYF